VFVEPRKVRFGNMKLDDPALDFKPTRVGFVADVSSAARALMRQPIVALVPIVLWALPNAMISQGRQPSLWLFITCIALMFFMCGWAGVERIFFLRQIRRQNGHTQAAVQAGKAIHEPLYCSRSVCWIGFDPLVDLPHDRFWRLPEGR
jgi:hypothetical protein